MHHSVHGSVWFCDSGNSVYRSANGRHRGVTAYGGGAAHAAGAPDQAERLHHYGQGWSVWLRQRQLGCPRASRCGSFKAGNILAKTHTLLCSCARGWERRCCDHLPTTNPVRRCDTRGEMQLGVASCCCFSCSDGWAGPACCVLRDASTEDGVDALRCGWREKRARRHTPLHTTAAYISPHRPTISHPYRTNAATPQHHTHPTTTPVHPTPPSRLRQPRANCATC